MHHLSDAGLLDEFFAFLKDLGMLEAFEQVSVTGVKRTLIPTVQGVLLSFLKVLQGGESMNELPRVLLSDLALMELVGFNAHHCENGLSKRGESSGTTKKKQGPLTAQSLADNIWKLTQEEMERLFNSMVQVLARRGWFAGTLLVALDGSKVPTPKSYEGCGKIKQTRKVKGKGQKDPVTQDAQGLAKAERAVVRERVVGRGHGKTVQEQRLRTELVGIEALTSYDQSGEAAMTQHAHRRDYVGQPINAVVVRTWENREPKTGGTVYLTNGAVRDPFVVFDTYDWHSVIENGLFKEGKHPWHLLNFPKRTQAAVVVHCHLPLLIMGLTTAFRLWHKQQALTPTEVLPTLRSALLGGEGIARWRQRLHEENRDKIIVFIGQAYGIFHLAEFALLTHLPLRILPSALGSPLAVLHRFGISP